MVTAFFVGFVMGGGILISGMADPKVVLGFLNLGGLVNGSWDSWDPRLAAVMAGALLVFIPAFRVIRRQAHPVLDSQFHLPTATKVDFRLVTGSAIFGIGWGLSGYCPGPAFAGLGAGRIEALILTGAMLLGMWLHPRLEHVFLTRFDLRHGTH
jgi:uncharacterized membrane protein YedE/YeeE